MAGVKLDAYGAGDVQADAIMETLDSNNRGYFGADFTEYATTARPAIAAGSVIECNGHLFEFASEEAITLTPADGPIYVKVIPAGSAITAQMTATAPVWSSSKYGWYGSGGSENHRYIGSMILDAGEYRNKVVYSTGREITTMDMATLSELHEGLSLGADATHDITFTYDWDVEAIAGIIFTATQQGASTAPSNLIISAIDITDEVITVTVKNEGTTNPGYDFFISCTASKLRV